MFLFWVHVRRFKTTVWSVSLFWNENKRIKIEILYRYDQLVYRSSIIECETLPSRLRSTFCNVEKGVVAIALLSFKVSSISFDEYFLYNKSEKLKMNWKTLQFS